MTAPGSPAMVPPARYLTTVRGVREVVLLGRADVAPWATRLEVHGLEPIEREGGAELTLLGCSSRYLGRRFTELSLSVAVRDVGAVGSYPSVYLVCALNTVRFFAWVERRFFHTPYAHGDVTVATRPRPACEARDKGRVFLRASPRPVDPATVLEKDTWEGAIHLPRRGTSDQVGRLFFARLTGAAIRLPYDAARDDYGLRPRSAGDPFSALDETGFQPTAWRIREDGVHARSKSIVRG